MLTSPSVTRVLLLPCAQASSIPTAAPNDLPQHQQAGSGVWVYPSEQMFYNAMKKKVGCWFGVVPGGLFGAAVVVFLVATGLLRCLRRNNTCFATIWKRSTLRRTYCTTNALDECDSRSCYLVILNGPRYHTATISYSSLALRAGTPPPKTCPWWSKSTTASTSGRGRWAGAAAWGLGAAT